MTLVIAEEFFLCDFDGLAQRSFYIITD